MNSENSIFIVFMFSLMAAVFYEDIKNYRIPDGYVKAAACLGLMNPDFELLSHVAAGTVLFLIMLIPSLVGSGCFGGGDIKLSGAVGFACGMKTGFWSLRIAFLISLPFCIYHLVKKDRMMMAFGPFLALGTILAIMLFSV